MARKLLLFIAAPLLLLSFYFFWPGDQVAVSIKAGSGASQAAEQLKASGAIRSATWFKVLVRLTGTDKRIMPGNYSFRRGSSSEEVLWRLITTPYISDIKVVIPEGWRLEQTAERLEANGVTSGAEFIKLAREQELEGYLFPSTYSFKKGQSAQDVLNLLKSEFDRQVRPLFSEGFPPGLDEKKVLIVASIVEREAVIASERPLIAAVYLNRIKKRMPLEADPTTQYALGYWKKPLTFKDLRTPSPYNTYYAKGLPPGPICSPGKASVEAVLRPANIDALYFVSDRMGRHVFNVSYQEHLKAKKRVEAAAKAAGVYW